MSERRARTANVDAFQITVRFVGRKGRIAITTPLGAVFRAEEQGIDSGSASR